MRSVIAIAFILAADAATRRHRHNWRGSRAARAGSRVYHRHGRDLGETPARRAAPRRRGNDCRAALRLAVDRVTRVEDVPDGGVSMPRPMMAMALVGDAATRPSRRG
jgi:hypothetical protein